MQIDLIDKANDINQAVATDCSYSDVTIKELKKIEMYFRKAYLMHRHVQKLFEEDHSEDSFMTDLSAALVRDQKYVKQRDSMDTYDING